MHEPHAVRGFTLSNEFGRIEFSGAVDLISANLGEFLIEFGNFKLPAAL